MDSKIKNGKVVLITGASAGIGKATAELMARNGYIVYGAARRIEKMHDLELLGVKPLAMDVTDEESMIRTIHHILKVEKKIDILVNNAGYGSYGALEDVPIAEAKNQFEVNIFGLSRLIQLVLPKMREAKAGKIINVSSIGGRIGEPHGAWYHATKFALEGLSDCLRMEVKGFNIDVVVIQPGAIKTEWTGIAKEKLLKVSGSTAYGNLVGKHAKVFDSAEKHGSNPMVIAKIILKSVTDKKPRTRYAAGSMAKPILFMRSILSDRMFDRLLLSQMK